MAAVKHGSELASGRREAQPQPASQEQRRMKKAYAPPRLIEYGRIADCTFATPHGQIKGCKSNCHIDKFGEPSALSGGS